MLQQFLKFALERVERSAPGRRHQALFIWPILNVTLVGLRGSIVARLQAHFFPPNQALNAQCVSESGGIELPVDNLAITIDSACCISVTIARL